MKTIKQEWIEEWLPEIKSAFKDLKNPKTAYKQIPNLLTASRLFSPLILLPVALTCNLFTTFFVAGAFALTDAFDGKIARKFHLQSKLGTLLDPVTDKLFALALLLPNIVTFPILTGCFIALEGIIAKINTKSKLNGNIPKSNLLGKTKTTFLSITSISLYLAKFPIIKTILPFLSITTLLLQTSAAIVYYKIELKEEREKKLVSNHSAKTDETTTTEKEKTLSPVLTSTDLKTKLEKEKESLLNKDEETKGYQYQKK